MPASLLDRASHAVATAIAATVAGALAGPPPRENEEQIFAVSQELERGVRLFLAEFSRACLPLCCTSEQIAQAGRAAYRAGNAAAVEPYDSLPSFDRQRYEEQGKASAEAVLGMLRASLDLPSEPQ